MRRMSGHEKECAFAAIAARIEGAKTSAERTEWRKFFNEVKNAPLDEEYPAVDLLKQKLESARKLARERHEQLMRDDPAYRENYTRVHEIWEGVSKPSPKSE